MTPIAQRQLMAGLVLMALFAWLAVGAPQPARFTDSLKPLAVGGGLLAAYFLLRGG